MYVLNVVKWLLNKCKNIFGYEFIFSLFIRDFLYHFTVLENCLIISCSIPFIFIFSLSQRKRLMIDLQLYDLLNLWHDRCTSTKDLIKCKFTKGIWK